MFHFIFRQTWKQTEFQLMEAWEWDKQILQYFHLLDIIETQVEVPFS